MKRIVMIMAVCVSFTTAEAGIWDQVKSVFVTPEKPKPPTIKVLVAHNINSAQIEVQGKYSIYDPYKNTRLASRIAPKGSKMESFSTGLRWGEEFPGVYQIQIVPDEAQMITIIDGKTYRGSIYIYDIGGAISIVNEVDIEDYLHSTMSEQIPPHTSEEAVAAAVIAARTHAYYQSFGSTNPYWHVNATKVDYHGIKKEVPNNQHLAKSVEATRFMVMSETGAYEGTITPFPVNLAINNADTNGNKLSLDEMEELAQKGHNAAQILGRSYPKAKIELSFSPEQTQEQKYIVEQPVRKPGGQTQR